ncbi:hypothetical protein BT96DRAFT_918893, partial [Gymnopus androsaceus JB14]
EEQQSFRRSRFTERGYIIPIRNTQINLETARAIHFILHPTFLPLLLFIATFIVGAGCR